MSAERALRYGSVCSGIEAATQAWHPLGWRAAFVSEIEAFPRAVLQHRWPEIPLHGDFTTIRSGDYEPIDLLVGGTPCQSFSVAGLRGGLGDQRGNLALEFLRLADRLRPRWLVWENVPGVLSSDGGRDFGSILGGLVELGYGFAFRVLDAQYFGVAQRRRRVFVVGYFGDWRRAAAVLFEPESLSGHPAPRRDARKGPAPVLANGAVGSNGAGIGRPGDPAFTLGATPAMAIQAGALRQNPAAGPDGVGIQPGIAYTLEARAEVQAVAYGLRNDAARSGKAKTPSLDASGKARLRDAGFNPLKDLAPTLDASGPHAVAFAPQAGGKQTSLGYDPEAGTAQTLSAHQTPAIIGSTVRRLTPRECERLQGFPDDHTLVPWRTGLAPDGPRYKAIGNSMAVPVMGWIGRRIATVDALAAR